MPKMMPKMFFLRKPRRQFLVLHSPPACQTSSELPSRSLKPVLQSHETSWWWRNNKIQVLGGGASIKYKTTNFQDATPENLKVALTSAGFSSISRNQKFNPSTSQGVDPVLSPADTFENARRTRIKANSRDIGKARDQWVSGPISLTNLSWWESKRVMLLVLYLTSFNI